MVFDIFSKSKEPTQTPWLSFEPSRKDLLQSKNKARSTGNESPPTSANQVATPMATFEKPWTLVLSIKNNAAGQDRSTYDCLDETPWRSSVTFTAASLLLAVSVTVIIFRIFGILRRKWSIRKQQQYELTSTKVNSQPPLTSLAELEKWLVDTSTQQQQLGNVTNNHTITLNTDFGECNLDTTHILKELTEIKLMSSVNTEHLQRAFKSALIENLSAIHNDGHLNLTAQSAAWISSVVSMSASGAHQMRSSPTYSSTRASSRHQRRRRADLSPVTSGDLSRVHSSGSSTSVSDNGIKMSPIITRIAQTPQSVELQLEDLDSAGERTRKFVSPRRLLNQDGSLYNGTSPTPSQRATPTKELMGGFNNERPHSPAPFDVIFRNGPPDKSARSPEAQAGSVGQVVGQQSLPLTQNDDLLTDNNETDPIINDKQEEVQRNEEDMEFDDVYACVDDDAFDYENDLSKRFLSWSPKRAQPLKASTPKPLRKNLPVTAAIGSTKVMTPSMQSREPLLSPKDNLHLGLNPSIASPNEAFLGRHPVGQQFVGNTDTDVLTSPKEVDDLVGFSSRQDPLASTTPAITVGNVQQAEDVSSDSSMRYSESDADDHQNSSRPLQENGLDQNQIPHVQPQDINPPTTATGPHDNVFEEQVSEDWGTSTTVVYADPLDSTMKKSDVESKASEKLPDFVHHDLGEISSDESERAGSSLKTSRTSSQGSQWNTPSKFSQSSPTADDGVSHAHPQVSGSSRRRSPSLRSSSPNYHSDPAVSDSAGKKEARRQLMYRSFSDDEASYLKPTGRDIDDDITIVQSRASPEPKVLNPIDELPSTSEEEGTDSTSHRASAALHQQQLHNGVEAPMVPRATHQHQHKHHHQSVALGSDLAQSTVVEAHSEQQVDSVAPNDLEEITHSTVATTAVPRPSAFQWALIAKSGITQQKRQSNQLNLATVDQFVPAVYSDHYSAAERNQRPQLLQQGSNRGKLLSTMFGRKPFATYDTASLPDDSSVTSSLSFASRASTGRVTARRVSVYISDESDRDSTVSNPAPKAMGHRQSITKSTLHNGKRGSFSSETSNSADLAYRVRSHFLNSQHIFPPTKNQGM